MRERSCLPELKPQAATWWPWGQCDIYVMIDISAIATWLKLGSNHFCKCISLSYE
jgi:hypothetical protein